MDLCSLPDDTLICVSIYVYDISLYAYIYIYIYILCICIDVCYVQRWSVTILDAKCKKHRYIFKNHKIKPKYSCNSEFHAKAIIRHIISFLSKNKQKNLFVKFRIKIQNTNMDKTKVHGFFFTSSFFFNKNLFKCLHLLISSDNLFNMLLSLMWLTIQRFSAKHNLHNLHNE